VIDDPDRCYEAARAKDPRFDGWFIVAVTSTGIYCRPSCPARTPKREHTRFYPSAAAAQLAGYRACRRCRPDAAPGSPEWNVRADVVARAMRLVRDGVVDREGVAGLARRLGYGVRQLNRLVTAELGAGPLAIARAQRSQTARVLLERTDLAAADVAFAAGFSSVRQFNDTIREVFADTPSGLRARAPRAREGAAAGPGHAGGTPQRVRLRLPVREPFGAAPLLEFLGARAIPGVEEYTDGTYRRSLHLPHGPGVVALAAVVDDRGRSVVAADISLADLRDLTSAVSRCRQLLDLDADPVAIHEALAGDPLIGELVRSRPGLRVVGAVDGFELAVRAIVGQQVSVGGARTVARRIVDAAGGALAAADGAIRDLFPTPAELLASVEREPGAFAMPAPRRTALASLARATVDGDLVIDPGSDPDALRVALRALPGVGAWTAEYVAMRALRDPDAFLATDLGVESALRSLGATGDPAAIARPWRPWRSYATAYLWTAHPPGPARRAAGARSGGAGRTPARDTTRRGRAA